MGKGNTEGGVWFISTKASKIYQTVAKPQGYLIQYLTDNMCVISKGDQRGEMIPWTEAENFLMNMV